MRQLTQSYIQSVIGDLKQKIQVFSQFRGEYNSRISQLAAEQKQQPEGADTEDSDKVEKARAEAEKLRIRYIKLKKELQEIHNTALVLHSRLKNAHQSAKQDVRIIQGKQRSLKHDKKLLDSALSAAQSEVQRLGSMLQDLSRWLASSQQLLSAAEPSVAGAGGDSSASSWVMRTDSYGNPMLKSREGSLFQETIHFDNHFGVTASHVKHKKGDSLFMNPSDAFIADALFNTAIKGSGSYTPAKKEWLSAGPSLTDQFFSAKQMMPYQDRPNYFNTLPSLKPYNSPPANYGMDFGRQDLYNHVGNKLGEVKNNFGSREIRNNMGGLEGKIENHFVQERLVRPDGTRHDILGDGAVLNQYGVSQSQISNYQPPSDPHAHWNSAGKMQISTLMDRMSTDQMGSSYMPSYQPYHNPY